LPKLTVTHFLSLDGVMENPGWTFPYWNEETAQFKTEESSNGEALLLGRVTYEGFAMAWPDSQDEGAAYFNGTRKYVVSNTLESAGWNNSVILRGDVMAEIARLKAGDGPGLVVHGSATLVRGLMAAGLVDTYRFLVYPVVIGEGRRLLDAGMTAKLRLVEARPFSTGVVGLIYEPASE